jgi:hypothetical protein
LTVHLLLLAVLTPGAPACAARSKPKADPSEVAVVRPASGENAAQMTEAALRADLMSYADRYASMSVDRLVVLERENNDAKTRDVGLVHRVYNLTAMFELAIAPNVSVALLDMMALATFTRLVWEKQYRDEVFGDAAQPVVDAMRELETDAWSIGASVLTGDQIRALRDLVEGWYRDHPNQVSVSHLRLANIGRGETSFVAEAERPGGFFGVGEAVDTLEDTQALLERTLWFVTRLQMVARWQIEMTFLRIMNSPEMAGLRENLETLPALPAEVAERSLTVSRELLHDITVEREAAVNQILTGLAEERRNLLDTIASAEGPRAALGDLRTTIDAMGGLVSRIDGLVARLEPLMPEKGAPAGAPPGRPFDITEYRDAAAEFTRTIERLDTLVGSIERTLAAPTLGERLPALYAEGRGLVRSLFRAGLALVAILLAGLLLVLVGYRWISLRMQPAAR